MMWRCLDHNADEAPLQASFCCETPKDIEALPQTALTIAKD